MSMNKVGGGRGCGDSWQCPSYSENSCQRGPAAHWASSLSPTLRHAPTHVTLWFQYSSQSLWCHSSCLCLSPSSDGWQALKRQELILRVISPSTPLDWLEMFVLSLFAWWGKQIHQAANYWTDCLSCLWE